MQVNGNQICLDITCSFKFHKDSHTGLERYSMRVSKWW